MKVALLGAAGGIGQPLSLLLKFQLPAGSDLALYDLAPFTPGVATDLGHIPTPVSVKGYTASTLMKDVDPKDAFDDIDKALTGAELVIITAGIARKPGMTRADLLKINAGIVAGLVRNVAKYCPKANIAVVSNPVNTTVPFAARVLKKAGCYNPAKLFGVTLLDAQRAETFLGQALNTNPAEKQISVIGGHSDSTILPLYSQVAAGRLAEDQIEGLRAHTRRGGTEVVEAKAGAGSATLSMAAAAARFAAVVVRGMQGDPTAICNAFVEKEQYGASFFAQPVRFGKDGISEYLPLGSMNEGEEKILKELLPQLKKDIATADDLAL